jgi:uncharacterized membrane protein (UPF0127 family)
MSLPRTALGALFVLSAVSGPALGQLPVLELNAGIHLIRAEVAGTFDSRARGLMFRRSLAPNSGMLFVFPDVSAHCMWMKNTYVPLSVAFMDEQGTIVSIHDMKPQDETSHCAAKPARFALEMNQGWFAQKGVKSGAKIGGLDKAPAPR